MNRHPSPQADSTVFLRYLPALASPEFNASHLTWDKKIKQVLNALSPDNKYLFDEIESFIEKWPGKRWDIEKAAPDLDDPPVIVNFFVALEERFTAVEDQLAAFAEAKQKADEEARRQAEELEDRKSEEARAAIVAAELLAIGAGEGGSDGGGQDEIATILWRWTSPIYRMGMGEGLASRQRVTLTSPRKRKKKRKKKKKMSSPMMT